MRLLVVLLGIVLSPAAFPHGEGSLAVPAYDYSTTEVTPFGIAADPRKAERTVRVEMRDTFRFIPDDITVRQGQVVRFIAANRGKLPHEMVLGTMKELKEHAAMMRKFPGMEHDEPQIAHVAPGDTGEIGWRFTRLGTFRFACLIPGHFEAGMVATIHVIPSPSKGGKP
jgi:uncharacterized cupredoxin-like copper-binding protein